MRRGLILAGLAALSAGIWLTATSSAQAQLPSQSQDPRTYYHYPYYYFPHSYAPNYVNWPDPRQSFQKPPGYMAYPPFLDPDFNYHLMRPMRNYRGFHFWLDQF